MNPDIGPNSASGRSEGARSRSPSSRAHGSGPSVLECRKLHKHFGGVVAVHEVDLQIRRGEFLAIIGDNGAGKSTLVKMLCGAIQPDGGEILYDGEPVSFTGPLDARLRGIETVHQDLALIPTMDVAQNLFLGREMVHHLRGVPLRILRRGSMIKKATDHLADLDVSVPAASGISVDRLSGGQRQGVAIARALTWASGVLIMDEPTAALGVKQSEAVLRLARRVSERGSAVILISHTLPYVLNFADRIVAMRHGRKVGDLPRSEATPEGLVSLIVGLEAENAVSNIIASHRTEEGG
jgi:fructose transport system ATP-binding protein